MSLLDIFKPSDGNNPHFPDGYVPNCFPHKDYSEEWDWSDHEVDDKKGGHI